MYSTILPDRTSLGRYLFFILAAFSLIILLIISSLVVLRSYDDYKQNINSIRTEYIENEKQKLKDEVDNVFEYISYMISTRENRIKKNLRDRIYEANDIATNLIKKYKGKKNQNEIKQLIFNALKPIRFNDGRGYYFFVSHAGKILMNGIDPALEGSRLASLENRNGKALEYNLRKISLEQGEGYYSYIWDKPNVKKINFKKISYIKRIDFLNGYIGTGEYVDDMESDIQKEILNRISQIRYGKDGYIFVVSYGGTTLMNGVQPELIGKNLWDMEDPNGVKVIQEEKRAAETPNGDFIFYSWKKPSTGIISPKASFVRGVHDWKWMIGAGAYLDDMEKLIQKEEAHYKNTIYASASDFLLTACVILLLALLLSLYLSKHFNKQITNFLTSFRELETVGIGLDTKSIKLKELRIIAETANSILAKRFEAEKENIENKARFSRIADNIPDMIYRMNLHEGKYEYVSPVSDNIFGCDADVFFNTPLLIQKLIHPDWKDFFEKEWENLLEGNAPPTYEYQIIHAKTGETRWLHQKNVLIKDENGKPIAIEGIVSDVTENKRTEEERIDREIFLNRIMDQSPFATWIADTDGNYVRSNKAMKKILNLTDEQLIGKYNIFEDSEVIKQGIMPQIESVYKEGKTIHFNLEWHGDNIEALNVSDSNKVFIDATMFPVFDAKGQQVNVVTIWIDVSERMNAQKEKELLQKQLQQAQKMESVGRLAGGVAHDFNNMLTGIKGNVQLAKMDLLQDDPLSEILDDIEAASDKAASLTKQLLAFSRKQIITPKVINLNDLISRMHKMLIRTIGEDINLRSIPASNLSNIKADPNQIEQIIVNLAINARDAMSKGGKLTIETADVTLDKHYTATHPYLETGEYVMLAISDNGEGICQADIQNIFDPFFTTKAEGEGTGLGLSTVYGIVKQHQGYIEVYSEPGNGTTFKIYFPVVRDKSQTITTNIQQENFPTGNENIFIVEDEEMVRKIAIKILERLGYNVRYSDNGVNALKIIREENLKIDLLLTDVVMPEMNGKDLAEEIIKLNGDIKVLFTSGYTKEVIAQHGILEDGIEFIGKPYNPQDLAVKVRSVLDKKQG